MIKIIRSTFTAIALGLLFSIPYAAPIDAAAKFDDSLNLMTIPNLPTCTAANSGSSAAVSDYAGSITWGTAVGTGGGTRVARVYCDGATWTVFAGGGGGTATITQQNFALPAPSTTLGNYSTGSCSGTPAIQDGAHNCLTMDDHFTSSVLNVYNSVSSPNNPWWPGLAMCNSGNGSEQCFDFPAADGSFISFPLTSWVNGGFNGSQSSVFYDYPFGTTQTVTGLSTQIGSFQPLSKDPDGSLALKAKWFFPNPNSLSGTWCTTTGGGTDCNYVNWIGAGITLGGLNRNNNTQPVSAALIPATGGLMQFRMRLDLTGLNNGFWPILQCSAVDVGSLNNHTNLNMEWGYNNITGDGVVMDPNKAVAFGINDHNIFDFNSSRPGGFNISTGDNNGGGATGVGNLANWHVFAAEWSGNGSSIWRYYVDGNLIASVAENSTGPSNGWSCSLSTMTTAQGLTSNAGEAGFHTMWNANQFPQSTPLNGPGPYTMWISDAQVYKKPGT